MARDRLELTDKQERMYEVLRKQIVKRAKHNRQGSYDTKKRYFQAVDRFCRFLSKEFALQKFANISNKHLAAYVEFQKNRGVTDKTLKTDLSAIRFFHDKFDSTRYILQTDNELLGANKLSRSGQNKAWSHREFQSFQALCKDMGNVRMAAAAALARREGLRIHETLKIDRSAAEKALKTGEVIIKGKGGKIRSVPISSESAQLLHELIQDVERGNKLFVQEGEKTHLVIKQFQNFINRHREKFQDPERAARIENGENIKMNVTFHGLRHAYAQDRYEEAKERGLNDRDARLEVSRLLGHERDEVTRIYIAN